MMVTVYHHTLRFTLLAFVAIAEDWRLFHLNFLDLQTIVVFF